MLNLSYYERVQGWFNFADLYSWQVSINSGSACFVEVGAWLGKSTCYMAAVIANSGKKIRFYTVDLWDLNKVSTFYSRQHRFSIYSYLQDGVFIEFMDNLQRSGAIEYVTPIRSESTQAATLFDDMSLDFVFIDGDHSYEGVKADLTAWYTKIKPGGFIAGHDYVAAPQDQMSCNPEVAKAVDEFFHVDPFSLLSSTNCWIYQKTC